MTTVDLYNYEGKKTGSIELPEELFAQPKNPTLLHQVYVAQGANRRHGSAHTKVRSEIRGGGRKPWKQKGTGNARTGSIRNPIWRGGGIIFGPRKNRNFSKNINTKMRRKALLIALSEKARSGKVIVTETLTLPETKTKTIATFLTRVGVLPSSAMIGLGDKERTTFLAVRNIPKTKAMEVEKFNVYDLLNTEYVVLSTAGIEGLQNQFTK